MGLKRVGIRTALVAGALLVAPPLVSAQVSLGAKLGVNFGDLSGINELEVSKGQNIVGGLYALFGFGGRWGIQPELLFSERSVGLKETGGSESATVKQGFLEIPLLLNVRLLEGVIEPQLYGGGSVSFETSCNFDDLQSASVSCADNDLDTTSSLWAGLVGVALDLDLGPIVLGLDGRYNYGFTGIDSEPDSGDDEATWRYFSLMFEAGIAIGR